MTVRLESFHRDRPFRGAIFDFNGTLFWDTEQHNESWVRSIGKYGVSVTPELLFAQFHGKPNDSIIRGLLGEQTPDELVKEITADKERIYQELCLEQGKCDLAPGAAALLDFLKENAFPFTVATSAPAENVDFYFRHLRIGRWFDREKIVFFDGTFPGKPNAAFYQRALGVIGCPAEETVIFEDAPSGILAAENAGCRTIVCVDSEKSDYSRCPYPVITNFNEIDRQIFQI